LILLLCECRRRRVKLRGSSRPSRCSYSRLEADTLFFIFYFQPITRQQQLAAKALRASGWLFHMQACLCSCAALQPWWRRRSFDVCELWRSHSLQTAFDLDAAAVERDGRGCARAAFPALFIQQCDVAADYRGVRAREFHLLRL
jgi:hypothetical protein